ncbi:MAG: hypothetical protein HUJ91_01295 [Bacteroidales bacterium]|nr:hypothetical protein [Bacteroidales bacterium]
MNKKVALLAIAVLLLGGLRAGACTTAVISARASASGRPMLWKQRDSDHEWNHIGYFKGEKYGFTALVNSDGEIPATSIYAGANEVGFAIMNNVSYNLSSNDYDNPQKNGSTMMEALGVCRTLDDFEAFLKALPFPYPVESNFGVIDAEGGAAYFEAGNTGFTRYDVDDTEEGYLCRTNFSLSGREDDGSGYIRYETVTQLFAEADGKFTPDWCFSVPARSFRHSLTGIDLADIPDSALGSGMVHDRDYIPRPSTTACVVIEGVTPDMKCDQSRMWCAVGYTPVTYAIPVFIAAGENIPECFVLDEEHKAPASRISMELKGIAYPVKRGSGPNYLHYTLLRSRIAPLVAEAEAEEFRQAARFLKKCGDNVTPQNAEEFYGKMMKRFERYCDKVHSQMASWQ